MTRAGDVVAVVVLVLQLLAAGRDRRKRGRGMRDAIGGKRVVCVLQLRDLAGSERNLLFGTTAGRDFWIWYGRRVLRSDWVGN